MENYIDESVVLSILFFPFICLGLGTFYTINYFKVKN
jgi:hypothetical protein